MGNFVDMVGNKYGRLTIISRTQTYGRARFIALCDCGNQTEVDGYQTRKGNINSCGCYLKELQSSPQRAAFLKSIAGKSTLTHGLSKTRTYAVWKTMRQRCLNPKNQDYRFYGAKGVTICDRWNSYELFIADMGEAPLGLTIDRIDPAGNYCPENCRWATWEVQYANKRDAHV